ncbi:MULTISPECIES: SDR family NAD(P)-dependent oxidoreductase [Sphingobium]|uniref:SDR family NAD(P)-dependent oxidoreductase n=1 Tax=Sphingobium sp. MI1205 TaxID=407020 RepID=UPI000770659B|nr:SDR family NAD(P)-dependent oxidoreductase [Sphingobium sp. MI1205]AMK19589.1 putative oxidoreductase [Sphingobium sp. MI1205]
MHGKVAIVTGGVSGMGEAITLRLLKEGATVLALDINSEAVAAFAEKHRSPRLLVQVADISDPATAPVSVTRCLDEAGRLDFLVNAAGVPGQISLLHEASEPDFDQVLAVNLKGGFLMYKAVAAHLIEQAQSGSIVNIASTAGIRPWPTAGIYSASKHGIVGLTVTAALEVAAHGIRVNAICPGIIDTPMYRRNTNANIVAVAEQRIPLGKVGNATAIADAALWLLGPEASYVTGAILPVDGGLALT